MVARKMTGELKEFGRKLRYNPALAWRGWGILREILADVRTEHIPKTSQEYYHYINQFRHNLFFAPTNRN
jgi:hypothetical protein